MTAGELLGSFERFIARQEDLRGVRQLSVEQLEGLHVAQAAIEDIIAGRMR